MAKIGAIAAFLVLGISATSQSCGGGTNNSNGAITVPKNSIAVPKKGIVLIFCDVTSSLQESEVEEAARLASDILDSLPAGTKYALYPIQKETQRLKEITSGEVPQDDPTIDELVKAERRQMISQNVEGFFKSANEKGVQPEDRTCILNTLNYAKRYFQQDAEREPELVFISDMIEQCSITPMHRRVDLKKQSPLEALQLAAKFPSAPDLSNVHPTIIIPTTSDTYSVPSGQRPNVDDLRKFWYTVFRACKIPESALEDSYWLSGVPTRFRRSR